MSERIDGARPQHLSATLSNLIELIERIEKTIDPVEWQATGKIKYSFEPGSRLELFQDCYRYGLKGRNKLAISRAREKKCLTGRKISTVRINVQPYC